MLSLTSTSSCAAKSMSTERNIRIGLEAISNSKSRTAISVENDVSRKYVRKQENKIRDAVEAAFEEKDDTVLFTIHVTLGWIKQLVISLILVKTSYRNIISLLNDIFDYPIALGSITNIFNDATEKALIINNAEDLSPVEVTANDELYHRGKPILSGIDTRSLYCYLLSQENHRDEDTWAILLMDAQDKGLNPRVTISDDANGLKAGHQLVFPDAPCYYDNFHLTQSLIDLRRFFRNRLKTAITVRDTLENKILKKPSVKDQLFDKLSLAIDEQARAQRLSHTIDTLISWLEHDVLNKAGYSLGHREELYDFIVAEFKVLELLEPHRITAMRITLENKKQSALAFVSELEGKFTFIANQYEMPLANVWQLCHCLRYSIGGDQYALQSLALQDQLGSRYDDVEDAVIQALDSTERTSSMVENLNGRVRRHIYYRQEIGHGYLDLLRFYFNHKKIDRSTRAQRHGKSPAEVLRGKPHSHWLELLGFERFKRAA